MLFTDSKGDENDQDESEKYSNQDISPAGDFGWLAAVKHRELGSSTIQYKFYLITIVWIEIQSDS